MFRVPAAAEPLVSAIRDAFTEPTWRRFCVLMCGWIVTMGRRTVSHTLVPIAIAPLTKRQRGHWTDYHRLLSSAKFSMLILASTLLRQVVALLPANAVIELVADDTVDGKEGDQVWAKGAHRDSTRSSRSKTAIKFGHCWLVMCVLVQLKGWDRPWALPILCGMCLSPKVASTVKRRPKTPSQLALQMLKCLMRWLPDRKFILIGDSKVVTHQTVAFAQQHSDRLIVIGRLRGDANLYGAPKDPARRTRGGGYAKKGRKLPSPSKRIAKLEPTTQEIAWYGSSRRTVRHVSEQALWYDKHASAVTPIRWVCVLGNPNPKQNLTDAFFFSSDPQLNPARIIELYARRWNIEVTFEEARALLGLETTRHWCKQSVLRVTPLLLGLFSAVVLIWHRLPSSCRRVCSSATPCYRKRRITFVDVLAAVRRELWQTTLLRTRDQHRCLNALPPSLHRHLLWHLSAAA
jgi:hypothetical protein